MKQATLVAQPYRTIRSVLEILVCGLKKIGIELWPVFKLGLLCLWKMGFIFIRGIVRILRDLGSKNPTR